MQQVKRSVRLFGHATSVTLEQDFWDYLHQLATKRNTTITTLLEACDKNNQGNFSAHIRVQLLRHARALPSSLDV